MKNNNTEILTNEENNQTEPEGSKKVIAQNIAFFRKKMNLSQTELAAALSYSNKNISKWEQGDTTPDIFTLKKLAKIFGISLDTLTSPMSNDDKTAIKTKTVVPFRWKIYMLLLSNAILILLACIAIFVLKSVGFTAFPLWYFIVYITPAMDLSVLIFIACEKRRCGTIALSLFGWLVTICFYLSYIHAQNIAYIFIIAVGYQIFAPIFSKLINSGKIIKLNKLLIKKSTRENNKT